MKLKDFLSRSFYDARRMFSLKENSVNNNKPSINPLEIISNLNWDEGQDLELKSARGGLPKSLWETYSAMANTHGGIILLGVEDNGSVSGITDTKKIKKSFWDTINNRGKVSINILSETDIAEIETSGQVILVINVPQAGRYQKPVYLDQNPMTGTYRRSYEGDYHCTEQEVHSMFSDRAESSPDSRMLDNFNFSDIDLTSLHQYRQILASHKPSHPWLSIDDIELLTKLGGWRRDRKTEKEGLTIAGLLMFGRDEAIREAIPGYHVDYQEKSSNDPDVRWTDRITIDGTWNANLFQFYQRVIQRLSADLKMPFQLDSELLRKGETGVHEAIREALVNTLIHADYQGIGGILVQKYNDRFCFYNPGTILLPFDQLLRGNLSECRNKTLQTMFMMFGAAEKAGSGIDKIIKGWSSQHWRVPLVRELQHPDRVYWELLMISLIPNESLTRLQKCFKDIFESFNPLEVQALVTADIEGIVDNARLRQISNNHATDITHVLQGLVAKGALVQEGQTRWSRYRLLNQVNDSIHKGDHFLHKGDSSPHKSDHSPHKDNYSIHKGDDLLHRTINSIETNSQDRHIFMQLSDEELIQLYQIASPARQNRRLVPKEMEKIIRALCIDRWLTRKQLATLVNRNSEGLLSRFLTPMVEHNILCLQYPDKPNRADQAYIAT